MDYYEEALEMLRNDPRSFSELGEAIGIRWETIRDLKRGTYERFYHQTIKKVAAYYFPSKISA